MERSGRCLSKVGMKSFGVLIMQAAFGIGIVHTSQRRQSVAQFVRPAIRRWSVQTTNS